MLSNKTKSLLKIILNIKPSLRFLMSYIVIWLVWHNELILSFLMADGDFFFRSQSAVNAVTSNQYLVVLLLTIVLTLIRYGFDSLAQVLADDDNHEEFTLLQNGKSAKTENETDIKQLLATLDGVQVKLADALAREKQAKKEKTETIGNIFQLQTKLDELSADIIILTKENDKLKAAMNNKENDVLCQS